MCQIEDSSDLLTEKRLNLDPEISSADSNTASEREELDLENEKDEEILDWKSEDLDVDEFSEISDKKNHQRWLHHENYFADSPYFVASVEKEMNHAMIVKNTLKEIVCDISAFSRAGAQMAQATRRLSSSCRLNADISTRELVEVKQNALGLRLSTLLKALGKSLHDIAAAQENMCKMVEETIGSSFIEQMKNDMKDAKKLKLEAFGKTEVTEKVFAKYINGTQRVDLAIPTPNSMNEIIVSLATSELSRLNLIHHFVNTKHQRNLKLCKSLLSVVQNLTSNYSKCANAASIIMPPLEKAKKDLTEKYSKDSGLWQERSSRIINTLSSVKPYDSNGIEDLIKVRCTSEDEKKNECTLDSRSKIEKETKFWEIPNKLAESSRCRRPTPEGVVLEGWLYKKNSSFISGETWGRQWYILKSDALYVLESSIATTSFVKEKVCDIVLTTVRFEESPVARYSFQLISPSSNQPITLSARGPKELMAWVNGIRSSVEKELARGKAHRVNLNDCVGYSPKRHSSEIITTILEPSITQQWNASECQSTKLHDELCDLDDSDDLSPMVQEIMGANPTCADCDMPGPEWVSLNLGISMCLNCSGVHRSLGVHISKVRSLSLDSLTDSESRLFLSLGNERMNKVWENEYKENSIVKKPISRTDRTTREKWIIDKYVMKKYLKQNPSKSGSTDTIVNQSKELYKAAKNGNTIKIAIALAHGARLDWKNEEEGGQTALHVCMLGLQNGKKGNFAESVELLLQNGAMF